MNFAVHTKCSMLFDGHNGTAVAIYAKENILNNILSVIPSDLNRDEWIAALPRALVAGFVKTDKEFQQKVLLEYSERVRITCSGVEVGRLNTSGGAEPRVALKHAKEGTESSACSWRKTDTSGAEADWESSHSLLCTGERSDPAHREALLKFNKHANDYVDRGQHSLETITLLLAPKIEYPENVHLIRGNHETADINALFDFRIECIERMNKSIAKCGSLANFSQELQKLEEYRMNQKSIDSMGDYIKCQVIGYLDHFGTSFPVKVIRHCNRDYNKCSKLQNLLH
ncbi:putative protein phosphatase 2C [Arachis hypogaea]|nr:putative protein phosphatase 2C [Arachis hypogaea]